MADDSLNLPVTYLNGTVENRPSGTGEVYLLWFPASSKAYVGLTINSVLIRYRDHIKRAADLAPAWAICRAIRKYGDPQLFVLEQPMLGDDLKAAERRWISELGTMTPHGYNITGGGDGCFGIVILRNEETGEIQSWPREDARPDGWLHTTAGSTPYRDPSTGECARFPAGDEPDGWVHVSTGMVTCRNSKTGRTKNFPKGEIPDGWDFVATGRVTCRNVETGRTKNFPKGEIPDGWVFVATGRVTCRNLKTGRTKSFPKGEIPDGWVHVAVGTTPCRNLQTGQILRFPKGEIPEGWAHVSVGFVNCLNLETGEGARFPKGEIPDGWVHVATGFVNCRNPETGECARFPTDEIPEGWVNAATGLVVCSNIATGETKKFPKDEVPDGWELLITASWRDPAIRKNRMTRKPVRHLNSGVVYPTLPAAFREVGLGDESRYTVGVVRQKVVKTGRADYKGHRFELVRDAEITETAVETA